VNATKLIEAIRRKAHPVLNEEMEHQVEVCLESDDPPDVLTDVIRADLFVSILFIAEDNRDQALVRVCNDVLIDAGYLVPRPKDAQVTVMGRDKAVVRKGIKYDCVGGLESWIRE
jgi:hypothetical protein